MLTMTPQRRWPEGGKQISLSLTPTGRQGCCMPCMPTLESCVYGCVYVCIDHSNAVRKYVRFVCGNRHTLVRTHVCMWQQSQLPVCLSV